MCHYSPFVAAVIITAAVRATLRIKRKEFRERNRWLWEPPLRNARYAPFVLNFVENILTKVVF
jgi:hypothetical protein